MTDRAPDPQKWCPSCRMRFRVNSPEPRDLYGPLHIDRKAYHWLENAARLFVQQSGDDVWTAEDFVAWVRNDIYGMKPVIIEHDGAPPRFDTGAIAPRGQPSAHRHPFELPQADWRPARREAEG